MPERIVHHISDTARWVAAYRATETLREDALFRDPLAARFAGERGQDIAAKLPRTMRQHVWPMILRTKVIDDLVVAAAAAGVDRVLDLAAGFDARPYRLSLPPELVWIEADLPVILDEKERLLASELARCRVVRERVDLADASARAAFFDRALAGAGRALVLTEGLVIYFAEDAVRSLALELAARPAVRSWVLDVVSPSVLRRIRKQVGHRFSPDAEMRFAPADGLSFFSPLGWRVGAARSLLHEAFHAKRLPLLLRPFALFPSPDPEHPGSKPWSFVARLDRSESTLGSRA